DVPEVHRVTRGGDGQRDRLVGLDRLARSPVHGERVAVRVGATARGAGGDVQRAGGRRAAHGERPVARAAGGAGRSARRPAGTALFRSDVPEVHRVTRGGDGQRDRLVGLDRLARSPVHGERVAVRVGAAARGAGGDVQRAGGRRAV